MSQEIEAQLKHLLERCERSLGVMHGIVMSKRWDRLDDREHGFNMSMKQLQDFVETHQQEVNMMTDYADRFQRLGMQQRRMMRLIASHMRGISEDLSRTDYVLRRLDQFSEELRSS
jgi:hypothetical protein